MPNGEEEFKHGDKKGQPDTASKKQKKRKPTTQKKDQSESLQGEIPSVLPSFLESRPGTSFTGDEIQQEELPRRFGELSVGEATLGAEAIQPPRIDSSGIQKQRKGIKDPLVPGAEPSGSGGPKAKNVKMEGKKGKKPDLSKKDDEKSDEIEERIKRSKGSTEDSLVELSKLGLSYKEAFQNIPMRPNMKEGQVGTPVPLNTNFFRMRLRGNFVYHYDITFSRPDDQEAVKEEQEIGRKFKRVSKKIHQQLLAKFVNTTGRDLFKGVRYGFDNSKILVTNKPLAGIPKEGAKFAFKYDEDENTDKPRRPEPYLIDILPAQRIELKLDVANSQSMSNNRTVLQMLDIITKTHAFNNQIVYGSKIFYRNTPNNPRVLMESRNGPTPFEIAFGYHQSTRICQDGPMQNIDRATAVLFREGPLLDRILELTGKNFLKYPLDFHELLKDFILLRVKTDYRGFYSRHTIRSFSLKSCDQTFFNDANGRRSVAEYFQTQYRILLRYPHLPCIDYGQEGKSRYVPIELCTLLPDQRYQRKLREDLIRILSQQTTGQKPYQRLDKAKDDANVIGRQDVLKDFQIELSRDSVKVTGRIIPSPRLHYSNDKNFQPKDPGDWNMKQPTQKKFLSQSRLQRWVIIAVDAQRCIDQPLADKLTAKLQEIGNMVGLTIEKPLRSLAIIRKNNLKDLFTKCSKLGLQLILCITPDRPDLYAEIKSLGDCTFGIPTQNINERHYNPRSPAGQKMLTEAYLFNLVLKIHSKIGGVNLAISENCKPNLLRGDTMVVGVDVNHPSPGDNSPSIAAVVGSYDSEFASYNSNIRINESRDEIVDVATMIKPILENYKNRRKCFPANIIVYRDGVSEGQFAHILAYEIIPLRDALQQIGSKLTYIIVQKRHSTRFCPRDRDNSTINGNILPGCVVDTVICHYKLFDFYLCSQNSFLGTARPGKYTVLLDDSSSNADELQKATYYLCYLFARACKSISDPAPARYAHHLAARGKIHYQETLKNNPQIRNTNAELSRYISVVDRLKNILYFI